MILAFIPLLFLLSFMKLDAISESRLVGLQPTFLLRLRLFFLLAKAIGWRPSVNSGLRSAAAQNRLHLANPQNSPAGGSSHEVGRACDLNYTKAGVTLLKATPKAVWVATGLPWLMTLCGLRWGGNFSTYHDPPCR